MPNQHRFPLMRPHSGLIDQCPGDYPHSINTALARYLFLVGTVPEFSDSERSLMHDACNGWATQLEPPDTLHYGLVAQVQDAIALECLDKKWNVDGAALVAKLETLTPLQAIALIHHIEQFWQSAASVTR